jgi:hypothetical protein
VPLRFLASAEEIRETINAHLLHGLSAVAQRRSLPLVSTIDEMEETAKAYVAGIIDGEGSISLARHFGARTYGRYVYPVVRVANTDRRLIDWLEENVPLKAARQYRSAMNERCKDVHHIGWAGAQAYALLRILRPFLVLKGEQADVVLGLEARNAAALEAAGVKRFGHGRELPEDLHRARQAAYERLLVLNRRGVSGHAIDA